MTSQTLLPNPPPPKKKINFMKITSTGKLRNSIIGYR